VINIKKILFFLSIFFIFNISVLDSNSSKYLLYDKKDIYLEDYFTLYFKDVNSYRLESIINGLKVNIVSYIIDGNEYYVRNINDLIYEYTKDLELKDKLYYYDNGIDIEGINIICEVSELMVIDNLIDII
jgi:hypothetical protein